VDERQAAEAGMDAKTLLPQESWPFENAISGIAVREDFAGESCDCDHRITEYSNGIRLLQLRK
jgi:hypothetical protein